MPTKDPTETSAATKISSITDERIEETITEFESWASKHLMEGKRLRDITAAYCQTFPGRTVELIIALYCEYVDLKEACHERSQTD